MPIIQMSLTLTCSTPPSVGAGGSHATLADKVVTRNARRQFVIPASQVKGKLRHACEQLLRNDMALCYPPQPNRMCPQIDKDDKGKVLPTIEVRAHPQPRCLLCQIFGSPADPSLLRFHDLVADHPDQPDLPEETLRPMVSLNRRRHTAEAKRLFLFETAPHFEGLKFHNSEAVTGRVATVAHAHILLAGLKLLFAWGGGASRGLGWGTVEAQCSLDGTPINFNAGEVKQLCQR